jgi:hypothetical protein
MPIFNISPLDKSNITIREQAYDMQGTGKPLTTTVRDPIQIFQELKKCKHNAMQAERQKQQLLEEKAKRDYNAFVNKYPNISYRYTIDRQLMDFDYFMKNKYGCKCCSKRFDNEQDHKLHERTHMLYMKV